MTSPRAASAASVDFLQPNGPPWQIEVSILHAAATALFDPRLGLFHKCGVADGIAARGHRLQERSIVLHQAGLHVRPVVFPRLGLISAVFLEHVVGHKLLGLAHGHVPPIAAPRIRLQSLEPLLTSHPAARGDFHGVQVDVPRRGQQVHIVLDQLRLEAALEEMTGPAVLVARVEGIGRQQPLHKDGKVSPRRANQEVDVVFHQDVGVEHNARKMQMVR